MGMERGTARRRIVVEVVHDASPENIQNWRQALQMLAVLDERRRLGAHDGPARPVAVTAPAPAEPLSASRPGDQRGRDTVTEDGNGETGEANGESQERGEILKPAIAVYWWDPIAEDDEEGDTTDAGAGDREEHGVAR